MVNTGLWISPAAAVILVGVEGRICQNYPDSRFFAAIATESESHLSGHQRTAIDLQYLDGNVGSCRGK